MKCPRLKFEQIDLPCFPFLFSYVPLKIQPFFYILQWVRMEKDFCLLHMSGSMCHMYGGGMHGSCRRYWQTDSWCIVQPANITDNCMFNRVRPWVLHQMRTLFVLDHKQLNIYPWRSRLRIMPFVPSCHCLFQEAHEYHSNKGASMDKHNTSSMCRRRKHWFQSCQLLASSAWHASTALLLGSVGMLLF